VGGSVTGQQHDPGTHFGIPLAEQARIYLMSAYGPGADPSGREMRALLGIGFALLAIDARLEKSAGSLAGAASVLADLIAGGDHPPVPEQAVTPGQAAWIEENAYLWAGWQPGSWPVRDTLDPRGFRWDDPLKGA
jgi:hypothetical protein